MSACETCWTEANWRSRLRGGTTVEHYQALIAEHPDGCPTAVADPTDESTEGRG